MGVVSMVFCVIYSLLKFVSDASSDHGGKAPNDTAYKRWSCHSGLKLLCKLCRTSPPDLPFFGHAGHADPLDGWRCCSQKRVMLLLLYALFNHPRLLIQVARVQKAQFSYRLDGLVP